MKAVVVLIAVGAAGCDLVFPPGGGPRDASGGDAVSTTTDASQGDAPELPDARVDGTQGVDSDGDGVNDPIDNCPMTYNPEQYNKDSDLDGDLCDPCPHLSGFTGADLDDDTDGVGNGCDPRAGQSGDTAEFYGFYDSAEITGWIQAPAGQWMSGGGRLVQSNTSTTNRIVSPISADDGIVTIGVQGTDQAAGNVDHHLAVVTGIAGFDEYQCQAFAPPGPGGATVRVIAATETMYDVYPEPWPGGALLLQTLTITSTIKGSSHQCYVRTEPLGDPQAGILVTVGSHVGNVGIETDVMAADVSYLFVAHSGP